MMNDLKNVQEPHGFSRGFTEDGVMPNLTIFLAKLSNRGSLRRWPWEGYIALLVPPLLPLADASG